MQDEQLDVAARVAVYEHFVATAAPPDPAALAARLGVAPAALAASYRRLAEQRALVLDVAGAIAMAIPFAAAPTEVLVRGPAVDWWANCAFDGLGVPAMLAVDATVETRCPQSGAPIVVVARGGELSGGPCVLHMAVPLATWWDDIGDT